MLKSGVVPVSRGVDRYSQPMNEVKVRQTVVRPGDSRRHSVLRPRQIPRSPVAPSAGLESPTRRTSEMLDQRRGAVPVTVTHEYVVFGDEAELLWALYDSTVSPLDAVSATEHSESKESVLGYFAEPRITKIIAWEGDEPVGLGMVTNDLRLIYEPSLVFFEERYPEQAARDAIFYGMSVMVKPSRRGMTVFSRIYLDMWQIPAQANGVLAFDMCQFNREMFDGDQLVAGIASNFPNSSWQIVDTQIWYAAVLPEPLPQHRLP